MSNYECSPIKSCLSLYLEFPDSTDIYWAKYCRSNILLYKISLFPFKMADRYENHRCCLEKICYNSHILTIRWQYCPESFLKDHLIKAVYGSPFQRRKWRHLSAVELAPALVHSRRRKSKELGRLGQQQLLQKPWRWHWPMVVLTDINGPWPLDAHISFITVGSVPGLGFFWRCWHDNFIQK